MTFPKQSKYFHWKVIIIPKLTKLVGARYEVCGFLKKANPACFSFIFSLFIQTLLQFLHQINGKKCHVIPVYGAGIQTHNFWNMSLLP